MKELIQYGLQVCTIAGKVAREERTVQEKEKTPCKKDFLGVSLAYKGRWMVVLCNYTDAVASKIRSKTL